MNDASRCSIDVDVRYAETDQMGVVHHANYIVWFEQARTRLCSLTGFHYADIERRGYYLMVTKAEARYLKGARYGQTVQVACRMERFASRLLRFAYEVTCDGDTLVTGATEHVWIEVATGRPCRIPEFLKEPFRRLAPGSPAGSG